MNYLYCGSFFGTFVLMYRSNMKYVAGTSVVNPEIEPKKYIRTYWVSITKIDINYFTTTTTDLFAIYHA